jgi:hypothetical protein
MTSVTRALGAIGNSGASGTKQALAKQADKESAYYREHAAKRKTVTLQEITPVNLEEEQPRKQFNSAQLLDIMHQTATHWSRWKTPEQADLATLWAASTWFRGLDGIMLYPAHPRLFFIAPPGSGKTRDMKVIGAMTKDPTGIVKAPVTAPGLRDALEAGKTIRLDEVDRQIGSGRGHMDVQSIISAYERDTASLNGRQGGNNEQSLFGPMMLAAKPRILTTTGGWVDDLFERSFIITPEKHTDQGDPIPDLDEFFEEITGKIQKAMGMWAEASRPAEGLLRPIHSVPKALTGRMREIASPLLAVADRAVNPELVDSTGQDLRWAIRARTAAQNVLLGHGENGAEIIADLAERMGALTK